MQSMRCKDCYCQNMRMRMIDEELSKRGKQMKKDSDSRVWSFKQVKASIQ